MDWAENLEVKEVISAVSEYEAMLTVLTSADKRREITEVKEIAMKTYAVGYINWFNNELIIEFVQAEAEQDAMFMHSAVKGSTDHMDVNQPVEDLQREFFDMDCMVTAKEVPSASAGNGSANVE